MVSEGSVYRDMASMASRKHGTPRKREIKRGDCQCSAGLCPFPYCFYLVTLPQSHEMELYTLRIGLSPLANPLKKQTPSYTHRPRPSKSSHRGRLLYSIFLPFIHRSWSSMKEGICRERQLPVKYFLV